MNDEPDWFSDFSLGKPAAFTRAFDHFYYTMSFFAFKIIHNQTQAEDPEIDGLLPWASKNIRCRIHRKEDVLYVF